MLKRILFLVAMLISPLSIVIAGTISNGVWLPSACGAEPSPPVFKQKSIEEYSIEVSTDERYIKTVTENGKT